MLLTIDVGNTHTVLGLFDGQEIFEHWRISTETRCTADELAVLLQGLMGMHPLLGDLGDGIDGIAICSTVPSVLHELREVTRRSYGDVPSILVEPGIKLFRSRSWSSSSSVQSSIRSSGSHSCRTPAPSGHHQPEQRHPAHDTVQGLRETSPGAAGESHGHRLQHPAQGRSSPAVPHGESIDLLGERTARTTSVLAVQQTDRQTDPYRLITHRAIGRIARPLCRASACGPFWTVRAKAVMQRLLRDARREREADPLLPRRLA